MTMMDWADQWPDAQSISNSNPEPFTADELSVLTGLDWQQMTLDQWDYQSAVGNLTLRESMIHHLYPNNHPDDLICCAGAQEALFVVFNALLNGGDHVITFTPAFEPLAMIPTLLNARLTTLPLSSTNKWEVDLNKLETALKDNAKLLVLNFPHNPTGAHITHDVMNQIISMCKKHQVQILSDEVFRGLEYDVKNRLPALADVSDQAISIGVSSKAYGLPAIRLGWILCRDAKLRKKMITIKNHLSICISGLDASFMLKIIPFSQQIWTRNTQIIISNIEHLQQALAHHPRFKCQIGKASSTCFIHIDDAKSFCQRFAENYGLILLPNHCFATQTEGFRLSLGYRNMKFHSNKWLNMDNICNDLNTTPSNLS